MAVRSIEALCERRFRAMGTEVHLAVVGGGEALLDRAQRRIAELEGRWSRFRPDSEVSLLNRLDGTTVIVTEDTVELVARAVTAWHATGGRFDPTVGRALAAHGYDRDFAHVRTRIAQVTAAAEPAPGPAAIEVDADLRAVRLPPGVSFDPGGIGKGLAADLTIDLLLGAGAEGALVNLGGDLRTAGRGPAADGWPVTVDDPLDPARELLRLALAGGAVATSSRLVRRWSTTAGPAHHLIDPATGRPADTEVIAATVVASEAWWAEVITKVLFLDGPAAVGDRRTGLPDHHAVVVTADGTRHCSPGLEGTLR